jgi:hypothetical protein
MKPMLVRSGLLTVSLVSALALMSCQAAPEAPPPPPPAPVSPPPPPPTALSTSVVQAAAAYEGYVRQASALTANFTDADSVQSEMKASAAYEPRQLSRGMVAYAAVLALQDPSFVAGVKQYSKDPTQRAEIINRIFADPAYAGQMPGADSAAGLIIARLTSDGEAIHKAGAAIKQSAYDIQHQKWSLTIVQDREGRLAAAKQLSNAVMAPSTEDSAHLMQAALTGQGLSVTPSAVHPPYTETVIRGLAIAALAVLGAAGDNNATQITALLEEQVGPFCLNMSKLNLYQCLAVSKPHYEDVFCMGQHSLMDTGRCVQKVVGTAPVEMMEDARRAQAAELKAKEDAEHPKAKTSRARHKKK